jgi:hypothetical protein
MQTDRIFYLPLAPGFLVVRVITFIILTVAIEFRLLRYEAYGRRD